MHKWINFFCLLFNLRPLKLWLCYHQFNSVTQSCPTLSNLMNRSTPGFPIFHHFLGFAYTLIHRVSDAIQPSHPLLSPSPTFNLSQHQGLFQGVSSRIRWPKYWSFSFSINLSNEDLGWFPLGWTSLIFLQSKGLSRVFCNTTIQNHQFFNTQLSLYTHTWLLEKP